MCRMMYSRVNWRKNDQEIKKQRCEIEKDRIIEDLRRQVERMNSFGRMTKDNSDDNIQEVPQRDAGGRQVDVL
jgi:hypothetical protein